MPNLTLAISEDLKKVMDEYKELNWSEIARRAIEERLYKLRVMDEILSNSQLTEEDTLALGRMVNKAVYKRHLQETRKKKK